MKTLTYYSFLICDHGHQKDIYANGLPIGQIIDEKFIPAKTIRNFRDIGGVAGTPYDNLEELKSAMIEIINKIDLSANSNMESDQINLARPIIESYVNRFNACFPVLISISDDDIKFKISQLRGMLQSGQIIDMFDQQLISDLKKGGVML